MSDFNVSTAVMFWVGDKMIIKEVLSASKKEYFT
jgi:hypothetical protein